MASEHVPFRMDFEQTVLDYDDETRVVRFIMRPDPRRYEAMKDDEGRTIYRDRYFDFIIGPDVLDGFAKQAVGLPSYYAPPKISSATEYSEERSAAVAEEIETGKHIPPRVDPDQHQALPTGESERWVTFVSVDIVGSTASRKRHGEKFDEALQYFVQEVGTVAGQFHAHILKLTGDGMIIYLDHESTNLQCDNTVDLALSLVDLTHRGLNPALKNAGLPELQVRVGADYGSARMKTYSVKATGYSTTDVVSDALNRAVKIQETAPPGEVRIGYDLYASVHVNWLERATEVADIGEEVGLPKYAAYSVR